MVNLATTDNNCGVPFLELKADSDVCPNIADYQNLIKIANTTVKDLTHDNSSLLVFPEVLGSFDDGIEDQHVFDLCGNPDELGKVKLTTGNLMGFIGIGDTQLRISSRFSQDDDNDFFMHIFCKEFSQ